MANKKRGLGTSFGSLLPDDFNESILVDKRDRVQKLLISDILVDPKQPRKTFDSGEIAELSQSIRRFGILQPIVVTPYENGYMIVAGERRYHAAKKAGLSYVPALVRTLEELERLEIGLIENMQRVDLSPLEQALSIARLNQQFNIDYSEIAKRLGKAHTTIINIVRLLQLPEAAREALEKRYISEGHARTILALKEDNARQEELLRRILQDKWSVRQAEQFARTHKASSGKEVSSSDKKSQRTSASQTPHTRQLGQKLGTTVSIKRRGTSGTLHIAFSSDKELDRILRELL